MKYEFIKGPRHHPIFSMIVSAPVTIRSRKETRREHHHQQQPQKKQQQLSNGYAKSFPFGGITEALGSRAALRDSRRGWLKSEKAWDLCALTHRWRPAGRRPRPDGVSQWATTWLVGIGQHCHLHNTTLLRTLWVDDLEGSGCPMKPLTSRINHIFRHFHMPN